MTALDFLPPSFSDDELPPEVPPEGSIIEQVKGGREKVTCPRCTKEIARFRLTLHEGSAQCRKYAEENGIAVAETPAGAEAPKPTKPKKPPATRRVKADDILGFAVGAIGQLVGMAVSPPTGMALRLEAGLLGVELDALVAGTMIDRVALQPVVKTKGRFEKIAPLVMFPALTFALDKNPQLLPQLYPMLRASMMEMLPALVAAKQRQAEEARKLADAARDLAATDPEFAQMFEGGGDPIDAIIQSLFPQTEPVFTDEPGSAWSESE